MPSSTADIVEHLDRARRALTDADLSDTDRPGLVDLLRASRAVQIATEAFVQRLASAQATTPDATDAATFLLDTGHQASGRGARREARRHRFLDQHPDLALERLHPEAIDVLERTVGRLRGPEREHFIERIPDLARRADDVPIDVFAAQVKTVERNMRNDHGDDELRQQIQASEMKRWTDRDTGMAHTLLILDPARDAEIHAAIDKKLRQLRHGSDPARLARSIDAAVALLMDRRPPGPARAGVGIIVDLETVTNGPHDATVSEFDDGRLVPPTALDRFLCDPIITLLGVDRADDVLKAIQARTASDLQRRALRAMHPTCAHPGCDVSFDRCQIHHLVHWRNGGPTELANLFPLCMTHHHDVHDRGWDYEVGPKRQLVPVPPDRTTRRTPGPAAPTAATSPPIRPRTASRDQRSTGRRGVDARGISDGSAVRST